MIDDDRVTELLRSAFPATADGAPSRDLWPLVGHRIDVPMRFSWFDIGLAAVVVVALIAVPQWLLLLGFHF